MTEKIGIIVGMENTFPPAFVAKVNETPGFHADLIKVGAIKERIPARGYDDYRVIVDRLSHEVPFYRFFLKTAALAGSYVINDPFWWSSDDKFFGFSLAAKIGVAVPRTVMLPQKAYMKGIDPQQSLRNLEYPLDWDGISRYVGFPAILKPADGGGWKNVHRVDSLDELLRVYDSTNELVMTLQQFIDFDEYVRCICIGREFILPIQYDPRKRAYIEHDGPFMPKALEQKILDGAYALNHALGYDMNSVEFACKDGVPYAIDFTNPAPDFDVHSILPKHFHMVVDEMARFCIKCAHEGRGHSGDYAYRRYVEKSSGDRPRRLT
jgi:hypothetical protein